MPIRTRPAHRLSVNTQRPLQNTHAVSPIASSMLPENLGKHVLA
jgi:hypothetical protein